MLSILIIHLCPRVWFPGRRAHHHGAGFSKKGWRRGGWSRNTSKRVQVQTIEMFLGFPGGSDSKESTCNSGDLDSISGLGRSPGGGHGKPLQYSCLENPHGQRSLAGYSPWGSKELETTGRLRTAQHGCFPFVQQNPTQQCKAIIPQFKKKMKKINK